MFAGTNVDDIVVLAVLNVSSRVEGRPRRWQIWAGQYAGIAALLGISMLAALGLTVVPGDWLWVLGLLPLGLGVHKLIAAVRARRSGGRASPAMATGLAGVMGITIANGGDNVAAYTPVFRTVSVGHTVTTVVVFALSVALWCLAGSWLVSHRRITGLIDRWGQWIIPAVYLAIGLYVFCKAGVPGR
ncbi:cadmium resistance transporter [Actinoallomurus acaciae]|uniref:Cadmium resistance transporter n=1 Tax=Actinoallomurus acaciae TaxID=502577 RepID=A0ABV5YPK8_9ACTN